MVVSRPRVVFCTGVASARATNCRRNSDFKRLCTGSLSIPKSNIGSVGDTLLATIGADVAESSAEAGLEMRIEAEVVAATCCSL